MPEQPSEVVEEPSAATTTRCRSRLSDEVGRELRGGEAHPVVIASAGPTGSRLRSGSARSRLTHERAHDAEHRERDHVRDLLPATDSPLARLSTSADDRDTRGTRPRTTHGQRAGELVGPRRLSADDDTEHLHRLLAALHVSRTDRLARRRPARPRRRGGARRSRRPAASDCSRWATFTASPHHRVLEASAAADRVPAITVPGVHARSRRRRPSHGVGAPALRRSAPSAAPASRSRSAAPVRRGPASGSGAPNTAITASPWNLSIMPPCVGDHLGHRREVLADDRRRPRAPGAVRRSSRTRGCR